MAKYTGNLQDENGNEFHLKFGDSRGFGMPTWSGTDLNDLQQTGFYYCDNVETHRPVGSLYWFVLVISRFDGTSGGVKQVAFRGTLSAVYIRHKDSDGVWSEWGQMITTYQKGDTIAFTNSGLQNYVGQWYSKSQARITIPLDKPIGSGVSGYSITGDFLIHSNGGYGSFTFSSTITGVMEKVQGGIGLRIDFPSDQNIASANTILTLQPRNTFAITLS